MDCQKSSLLESARELFRSTYGIKDDGSQAIAVSAPGRVNLIGEHVDYTGGYVLPMAIGFSTVCYGKGSLVSSKDASAGQCRIISSHIQSKSPVCFSTKNLKDLKALPHEHPDSWTNYVMGVVREYTMVDVAREDLCFSFDLAIVGNVPLGAGVSSSASLEVSVARFLESILKQKAFSDLNENDRTNEKTRNISRALRCRKSSNEFCGIPCGIMDQYVISAAVKGSALLIDCTTNDYTTVEMKESSDESSPVILVCNSQVQHENATGEYPLRVKQCQTSLEEIKKLFPDVKSLRYATMEHIETEDVKQNMDDVAYRRAKHVISENERTIEAKDALKTGNFVRMGELMNDSHTSMKDDYETSCSEIDILVSIAQSCPGVYGSRLTGGGFGGCTVTLVKKKHVKELIDTLEKKYKEKTGFECVCFETLPEDGCSVLLE